ncbi:hypothetical protein D1164_08165 [Mariniphaga sediminis]|uniref:DUF11 domain-containing protein n=1 Tax=Mariniphaga sediminis TaxID=1628158 RepID=A0A399D4H1_9BACT|nr:hypothetical protein [Mariniphaga sediminis]RIH65631.1 hypothetical protein D1164_08165 [Mariniphaga sediminis]
MKKQILIVTFFIVAFLAGTINAFAQVDDAQLDAAVASCPVPAVLNCGTADALHPLPGESYTYDIDIVNGNTIHWFVTTDVNVIASAALTTSHEAVGGTYVLNAGTAVAGTATYDDGTNTGDVLGVQWNYFSPGTTVLLVAFVVDAAGCTNNIEAYKIEPVFNFVLEIAALEDDGTIQNPAASKECVSPVQSATFDGTNLVMDYGDNYIFYIVSAANWVHSWDPTFVAPTSAGGSAVGTVEWAYADEAHLTTTTWNTDATPVLASHWGVSSVGASGQCIVLRVNIDHSNANEMIAAETYTTGVDGVMYNAATSDYSNGDLADLDDGGSGNCVNTITDDADYIITPRPDINAVTPTPFIPKN